MEFLNCSTKVNYCYIEIIMNYECNFFEQSEAIHCTYKEIQYGKHYLEN
jgi:hypothetical protein